MIQPERNLRSYLLIPTLLLLGALSHSGYGQESIATERPTLSIGPWTIPENSFQWEQGINYIETDNKVVFDAAFRAAVSESFEIRFILADLQQDIVLVGAKWMMIKPEGNKIGVGWALNMGTFEGSFRVLSYRVALTKPFTDRLSGYLDAGRVDGGFFGDFTLAYSLAERWSVTGDYWVHEDWQQTQFGLTYLIDNETQVDINGGLLFNTNSDYIVGIGFARRFKMKYTRNDE